MKKYLDFRGSTLFDSRGNNRGIIEDCIMDFKKKKICSVVLTKKEFFTTSYLLPYRDIKKMRDLIISDGEIHRLDKHILRKNKNLMVQGLIGREIITSEGERLGKLADLMFDESSGEIKALICSRGFFEDILEGRKLIMVDHGTMLGKQRIIVGSERFDIINHISFRKFNKG